MILTVQIQLFWRVNMKKFQLFFIVLAMFVLLLAACSGGNQATTTEEEKDNGTTDVAENNNDEQEDEEAEEEETYDLGGRVIKIVDHYERAPLPGDESYYGQIRQELFDAAEEKYNV